jgi:uncharacterized repeat protein (TIGR01451 family)
VIYWDKNNDGALDSGDPVVGDLSELTGGTNGASAAAGLDPGETARVFVKVLAPSGAGNGNINTTTLRAATGGTINGVSAPADGTALDVTTVIAGQVRLEKKQALDADCDGTPDTAYGTAIITTGAVPGACIRYQVTAINDGAADVTDVVLSDSTPANTRLDDGSRNAAGGSCGSGAADAAATCSTPGCVLTAPDCGDSGTVRAEIGTLTPTQSAVVTFGVMILP